MNASEAYVAKVKGVGLEYARTADLSKGLDFRAEHVSVTGKAVLLVGQRK